MVLESDFFPLQHFESFDKVRLHVILVSRFFPLCCFESFESFEACGCCLVASNAGLVSEPFSELGRRAPDPRCLGFGSFPSVQISK